MNALESLYTDVGFYCAGAPMAHLALTMPTAPPSTSTPIRPLLCYLVLHSLSGAYGAQKISQPLLRISRFIATKADVPIRKPNKERKIIKERNNKESQYRDQSRPSN